MEQYLRDSSLVQSVERRTVNPYVTGSSPVRGAKFKKPAFEQAFCFSARHASLWTHIQSSRRAVFVSLIPALTIPCRERQRVSFLSLCHRLTERRFVEGA